ncbi:MAG: Phosphate propanoyltransferase, partial [bacterium 42_11]
NRHIHLCKEHLEILFGNGYQLTKLRELRQPGQFACRETVNVVTSDGILEGVRVLGPLRSKTQFELSLTDARRLRINPPVVKSGSNVRIDKPVVVVGPRGSVVLEEGVCIAWRHIHLSPEEARLLGLRDGEEIEVEAEGERAVIFRRVWVRVDKSFVSEFHIDTDEANACGLKTGDYVRLLI